jgi:hypothetical protein
MFGGKPVELSANIPFMVARARRGRGRPRRWRASTRCSRATAAPWCHGGVGLGHGRVHEQAAPQHGVQPEAPNNLLVQMKNACRRHGARIAGALVMTHTSDSLRVRSNIFTT